MSYQTLKLEFNNKTVVVSINRPDKLNALNSSVMSELEHCFTELKKNDDVYVIILTGSGEKAFAAGADISELNKLNMIAAKEYAEKGQAVFDLIENMNKPVIAAVNGFALGGGCELALSCHIRLASENAKFGHPEVNLGLIPGYGGTQRLPMLVGKGKAIELLLTGNMIDAATALQLGLVNYVGSQEQLIEKAISILQIINSKAPVAIAKCINAANHAYTGIKGYETEIFGFSECFITEDVKEGTAAFLEKRKPNFKGK